MGAKNVSVQTLKRNAALTLGSMNTEFKSQSARKIKLG